METVAQVFVEKLYFLDVTLADGVRRRGDVESALLGETPEPLHDSARFAAATVDNVPGTVVRPYGADLSPEFLYRCGEEAPDNARSALG